MAPFFSLHVTNMDKASLGFLFVYEGVVRVLLTGGGLDEEIRTYTYICI